MNDLEWKIGKTVLAVVMFFWAQGSLIPLHAADEPSVRIQVNQEGKSIQRTVPSREEYTYIPGERRDPFISLLRRGSEQTMTGGELTPLQKVRVEDMKLVGIVKSRKGMTALIQTPDGKGYFLRPGVRVGMKEGVVEKILEDKVIVKEEKRDFLGQIQVSEIVLQLNKKEEARR